MFKTMVVKAFSKNGTEVAEVTDDGIVLEALCAYRDILIMSDDYDTPLVHAKLMLLHQEIYDARDRMK
jgi:hypothetical protein